MSVSDIVTAPATLLLWVFAGEHGRGFNVGLALVTVALLALLVATGGLE